MPLCCRAKGHGKRITRVSFWPNCWQISRRTWKTNYQSVDGGSRVQERRGRRTFCKVMKWWQSGRGVDSRPTEPKKLATRTPRRPRPLSSRAPKLLFVLLCDVNFMLFLLLLSRLLLWLLLLMPATSSLITRLECESGKRSERAAAPAAARDLPRPATARLSEVMYTQPN